MGVSTMTGCPGPEATTPAPSAPADASTAPAGCGVARTFVLTRHAEKASGGGQDPSLSDAGKERAGRLAKMLTGATVTRLVATEYKRTQEALAPLATQTGLTVETHAAADTSGLVRDLEAEPDAAYVVVAGHSNTVPDLLAALGPKGAAAITIPESQYGRVFVVTSPSKAECGSPTVVERSSD